MREQENGRWRYTIKGWATGIWESMQEYLSSKGRSCVATSGLSNATKL